MLAVAPDSFLFAEFRDSSLDIDIQSINLFRASVPSQQQRYCDTFFVIGASSAIGIMADGTQFQKRLMVSR